MSCMVRSKLMYCRGWDWWMMLSQVGQVFFSSRCFTRQLLQTERERRNSCWQVFSLHQNTPLDSPHRQHRRQRQLTCVQTLRHRGGVDEIAPADLARDVRVDCFQLHAPLHAVPTTTTVRAASRVFLNYSPIILPIAAGLPADFPLSHSRAENVQEKRPGSLPLRWKVRARENRHSALWPAV